MDPDRLPLSNHRLYDGNDVDDARDVLSRLFTEISIEPLNPRLPFRAQVNGVELPRISICHLQFDNGATAGPVQPLDFHTLQLNPTGDVIYKTDEGVAAGSARQGVMLSAGQTVRNRHSKDNGNLALIVKDHVIRDFLSAWTGEKPANSLKFELQFDPDARQTTSYLNYVDWFVREINRPGGILSEPVAVASFEHALLTAMLFGL